MAELALAGVPAVLVPYPPDIEYQLPNAEVYAAAGAATIIDETELPGSLADALVNRLELLLTNDERRTRMAANMRHMARPGAAANVTNVVYESLFSNNVRLAA